MRKNITVLFIFFVLIIYSNKIFAINSVKNNNQTETENIKIAQNKEIEEGYYSIASSLDENKVLDIVSARKDNCANVQLWKNVNENQQIFKITKTADNYFVIENINSNKVIDVANGIAKDGNNVWQYEQNETDAQKWKISWAEDDYFYIISKLGDFYLNVENTNPKNGTNICINSKKGNEQQKFRLKKIDIIIGEKTIKDGYYQIASALNNAKVLDISGADVRNTANVQVWENVGEKQQKFKIKYVGNGYYVIENVLSKKALDVQNGIGKSGNNVWQYESNGTNAQKWIIKECEDGYYNVVSSLNNLFLDVSNSNINNGTNIQISNKNKGESQKFKFIEVENITPKKTISNGVYKIAMLNQRDMVLDIDGAFLHNGANLQTWTYVEQPQQEFEVKCDPNGYYTIKNINSKKVLDVKNGIGKPKNNVWQYEANGSNAQKWIIKDLGWGIYNIVSACNDMYLTVSENTAKCGTNVEINKSKANNAQMFVFEEVKTVRLNEEYYGESGLKIKGDTRGQNLKCYRIGAGPNVLFATFAIHGWEDLYNNDGKALTQIAENFKNRLIQMQDEELANKWSIYIFPSVNPDGENYGYTHNGPGRTTLYSFAPDNKGIDLNRTWSTGYVSYQQDRNYNGTEPFQAIEARALRDFLLNHKATNGQTILVDLHGWLNETMGDNQIGELYRNQFSINKHISTYGRGYLINWAQANLGTNGRIARSCLVELPEYQDNSEKYINATLNMLRAIN